MKIWEPKPPGTLWATPGLLRDCFIFTFYSREVITTASTAQNSTQYPLHTVISQTPVQRHHLLAPKNVCEEILIDIPYLDLVPQISAKKSGAISGFAFSLLDGNNSAFLYL